MARVGVTVYLPLCCRRVNEYAPLASVVAVALVGPASATVTPGSGDPFDVTVPVCSKWCARAGALTHKQAIAITAVASRPLATGKRPRL